MPTRTGRTHDEGTPNGTLMTNYEPLPYLECSECGNRVAPKLEVPPCGHDAEQIERVLDSPGVVYSWTHAMIGQDRILVMADFCDGALRVAAPLVGATSISIGDPVRAVIGVETPTAIIPTTEGDG